MMVMLLKRVTSAAIGIPLVVVLVYCGGGWFLGLSLIVAGLGITEFMMLLEQRARLDTGMKLISYAGVLALLVSAYLDQVNSTTVIFIVFILLALAMVFRFSRIEMEELTLSFWGIIYVGGLTSFLVLLREGEYGKVLVLSLLAGVWVYDILAFFIGMKWGRRKISPQLSPQKSWEGALGGTAGVLVAALLVSLFGDGLYPQGYQWWLSMGAAIAVGAPLGDFLESALKRKLQVKDTSNLIPGHGGILDRVDSLLFTVPLVYFLGELLLFD